MSERTKDVLTWLVVVIVFAVGLYGAIGIFADGLKAMAAQQEVRDAR